MKHLPAFVPAALLPLQDWWRSSFSSLLSPSSRAAPSSLLLNPGIAAAATALAAYVVLIRALRYRRRDRILREYAKKHGGRCDREAVAEMTLEEAWVVLKEITELEFPSIFSASVFFALFKTYGIPSISKLLETTGQLGSDATASKRATDTGVLLGEMVLNGPDSPRKRDGIARMNYLHDRYRRAGKISDGDMLYTLGLFALEPCRWTARYEWRDLHDVERAALGTFWRDMGGAMGIPCEAPLEPHWADRKYRDGLAWLDAVDRWARAYEEDRMVPADSNEKVARGTLNMALFNTPGPLRPAAMGLISSVLEPRLRAAMRIQDPNPLQSLALETFFSLRRVFLRNLSPPRPKFLRFSLTSPGDDADNPRHFATQYLSHPWYVRPTLWSRWLGPEALRTRFLWGGVLPGDRNGETGKDGKDGGYQPEGYLIAELGPAAMKGKGREEMERIKEGLMARRAAMGAAGGVGGGGGGCPMGMGMGMGVGKAGGGDVEGVLRLN